MYIYNIFQIYIDIHYIKRATAHLCALYAKEPPALERQHNAEVQREFFIDNILGRIHFIIVMIRRTGLAPWEFEFPFVPLRALRQGAPALERQHNAEVRQLCPVVQGYLAHKKTHPP